MVIVCYLNISNQSDGKPFEDIASSRAPPPHKVVARVRPKRQRKPSIASLRAQYEAFELVVKHLPYVLRDLDDASSSANSTESDQDGPTDHDDQRMRSFLKRTILLSRQAQEELAKRSEYLGMLKRHYEGVANLRKLMRGLPLDAWFWMCERWRELTLKYYQPLSEDRCYEIMHETLQAIKSHRLPEGTKETGGFGWRDWVHLDANEHYVRFMTCKTMKNTDMNQLVDQTWSLYWDGDSFKKAHLGHNCEFFLQVLQEISPDVMIVQRVEQHPGIAQPTHSLGIAFRVQTETGYLIAYRCIESPQLESLMKAEGLSLCGSFTWDTFDVVHQDAQGECDAILFTVAGSIGSDNPAYARQARDGILNALVRYEIELMDSTILPIEPSTEEANVASIDSRAAP